MFAERSTFRADWATTCHVKHGVQLYMREYVNYRNELDVHYGNLQILFSI